MKLLLSLCLGAVLMVSTAFALPNDDGTTDNPNYNAAVELLIQDKTQEAINLLLTSAKAGHVDSQFLVGLKLSETGDVKGALYWFKKAAENGDFRSQQVLDIREQYK